MQHQAMRLDPQHARTIDCGCCGCMWQAVSSAVAAPYTAVQMVTGWGDESAGTEIADFGAASEQNEEHCSSQDDVHVCIDGYCDDPSQSFFAVFDGNGGSDCARFAAETLHATLADELPDADDGVFDAGSAAAARYTAGEGEVRGALTRAFASTDAVLERNGMGAMPETGCAVAACLVRREHGRRYLYAANVGDSRAVLSQGGQAIQLSHDHRATVPDEAQRVEGAGGVIFDGCVMGVLRVTRSLGHSPLKALISGTPAISRIELHDPDDDVLLLATDGVWDVMSNQEAVHFVRGALGAGGGCDAQAAAARLCELCMRRGSTDNISCIVVKLL